MSVVGGRRYEGLIGETKLRELTPPTCEASCRVVGRFWDPQSRQVFRAAEGVKTKPAAVYHEALSTLERLGIEGLIVVGGEGTLTIASEFSRLGLPVLGVPKTIDNDLACTELTFGFATALDIATEALDRLHTTAESHDRVMILEVMGRHAGWIALHSGIAGGADVILIPEIPFSMVSVADKVSSREAAGSRFCIMVVAEGAREIDQI
jgi:6-phosphofructokinase 1